MTEATERSMLRVSSTSIWATATIINSAAVHRDRGEVLGADHARIEQHDRQTDRGDGANEAELTLQEQTLQERGVSGVLGLS